MPRRRRERWYSLDGQRKIHETALRDNNGPRRVVSLVVLLVLVLLMMQQVSDPKKVQKVATAIGLMPSEQRKSPSLPELDLQSLKQNSTATQGTDQPDATGTLGTKTPEGNPKGSSSQNNQAIPADLKYTLSQLSNRSLDPVTEFYAQVFDQLLSDAPAETKSDLLRITLGLSDSNQTSDETNSSQTVRKWFAASELKVKRWIELADSIQGEGSPHSMLTGFLKSLQELNEQGNDLSKQLPPAQSNPGWSPSQFSQSLQLGLDRQLLKDFSDNTPWKSTERLPLARLLSKATQLEPKFAAKEISLSDIPTLSLQQLMSQTDTLRGQCFRIQGTIGLVEPQATLRLANNYTVNYHVLWLRTEDPSGQPIQIYAPISKEPSESLPGESKTADRWKKGQDITLAGFIAKRRAYASGKGGDIAPVLIATHIVDTPLVATHLVATDSQTDNNQVLSNATTPPTTEPNSLPTKFSIPYELAKLRTVRDWLPPIDWQVPLNLLQTRLESRLANLPRQLLPIDPLQSSSEPPTVINTDLNADNTQKDKQKDKQKEIQKNAPENLLASIDPSVATPNLLATLAVASKFRNEIRQIVSSNCFTLLASPPPTPDAIQTSKVLGEWSGRVTAIRKIPVDTTTMPGLGWSSIYALQIEQANPTDRSKVIVALAQEIPQSWTASGLTDRNNIVQPVKVQGLGVFQTDHPPKELSPGYILASRILWTNALNSTPPYVPSTQPSANSEQDSSLAWTSPHLSEGWRSLAASEWDLAHCDSLERMHGTPINSTDAEPLYSMLNLTRNNPHSTAVTLGTMDWIRRTEAMKANKQTISDNHRSVGERTRARFQVRRIQRIEVRNPEHQRWLGGNAYYQLDGLASIGANRVAVRYGKDFEPITFEKEFPMTLVSASVPTWVFHDPDPSIDTSNQQDATSPETGSDSEDAQEAADALPTLVWYPRIRIDVEGWAYRTWRFRTIEVSAATQDTGFQQAPMMVVDQWKLAQGPEFTSNGSSDTARTSNSRNSTSNILLTIAGLTGIAWFAYRFLQREKKPLRWR